MGSAGHGLAPAMVSRPAGRRLVARGMVAQEEHGGFREGPLAIGMAALRSRAPSALAGGVRGAGHQAAIRHDRLEPWEARASRAFIQPYQGENLADAWDRAPPVAGVGIVVLGQLDTRQRQLAEQVVSVRDPGAVPLDTLRDRRRGKARGAAGAMGLVGDVLADGGQMVLTVRMVEGGEARCPCAPPRPPAPEPITGGAPLGGIDVRRREHRAAEPPGDRIGIAPSVLRLAPGQGLPGEGVAQDDGPPLVGAAVGEPLPGEEACDTDDKSCPVGGDRREHGLWACLHMPMDHDLSVLGEEADVPGAGMHVEATVTRLLFGVQAP